MERIKENYQKILCDEVPLFFKEFLSVLELVRLKGISYYCGMDYGPKDIYSFKEYYSRYDHSVNTALMYYNFAKDKKGTIAMLFHDLSTPVFSHVIDIMTGDSINQEYTESFNQDVIRNIYRIDDLLNKNGISITDVLEPKNYSIGDNDRPRLCIDRLDSTLIDGLLWNKMLTLDDVKRIYNNLSIYLNEDGNKELGFIDLDVAKLFFEATIVDATYTDKIEDTYAMYFLGEIVKCLIKDGYISTNDLFTLEEKDILRIISGASPKIRRLWKVFTSLNKKNIFFEKTIKNNNNYYYCNSNTKRRFIDPLIGNARLSNIDEETKIKLNSYLDNKQQGFIYTRIRKEV